MDKVLKQRLVGASILIALAVIFLPMLFDGGQSEPVEERELALDVPERDAGDRRVRRLALDPDQARRPSGEEGPADPPPETRVEDTRSIDEMDRPEAGASERADSPPEGPRETDVVDSPETAPESQTEAAQPAPEPEPQPRETGSGESSPETESDSDAPTETDSASPATTEGDWVVQVAVFSSRETTDSIRQRLEDLGHRAMMDVLIRDQAELFRLRTGPYASEAAAEQARSQIDATVAGVDPVTRELSVDGAAADRQGLSVQVGSFASRNNAERLVGQLTDAGYDAFMFGEDSGGRTIWRVRVGAHAERADAERLLETLREEEGLEGIVVSNP